MLIISRGAHAPSACRPAREIQTRQVIARHLPWSRGSGRLRGIMSRKFVRAYDRRGGRQLLRYTTRLRGQRHDASVDCILGAFGGAASMREPAARVGPVRSMVFAAQIQFFNKAMSNDIKEVFRSLNSSSRQAAVGSWIRRSSLEKEGGRFRTSHFDMKSKHRATQVPSLARLSQPCKC